MKTKHILILIISTFTILAISCKKEGNETKISKYKKKKSHNSGQNCMNCHNVGGSGEGVFKIAGTIYNEGFTATLPNTTVKLYTAPNGGGSLVATVKVDGLGNFYTTEKVDFGDGLYPAVIGNQTTKYMNSSVQSGACYSCHNSITGKIWAK